MNTSVERGSMLPMKRQEIITKLKMEMPVIRERYGIIKMGLFGSFARDDAGPMSDIDLIVLFEEGKEQFRPFMQCIFYLEQIFGRRVELITEHSLDKRIRQDVLREVIWV
ncbi:nucleotidyltransferase family protein [Methanospirillum sp.]|uniref:nucleotidyltransferase family protein n=1 Tax=Methanospirillum sp. TaxID=45200 RepID=UPI0016AF17C6|nr:nucleotidyltransferase family protein [Methanospirillum sp.]NLW76967.1 nucleotidyltransferase family protein [Methanomicrobiales archaeon]